VAPNLIFSFKFNPAEEIEYFLAPCKGGEVPSTPLTTVFNVLEGDDGEWGELDFEVTGELRDVDEKDAFRFDEKRPPLLEKTASFGDRFKFQSPLASSCALEFERRNRAFIE